MYVNILTKSYFDPDGSSSVAEIVARAAELGHSAVCVCDRTMAYVPELCKECEKRGTRPVFGREFDLDGSSIILIAKDLTGYSELCYLSSIASLNNELVSKEDLVLHSMGLACVYSGGTIYESILHGWNDDESLQYFDHLFRSDMYYGVYSISEDNEFLISDIVADQFEINQELFELERRNKLKSIAVHDVTFAKKEDYQKHLILKGEESACPDSYLKSEPHIAATFAGKETAMIHVEELLSKVTGFIIPKRIPRLPEFTIPDAFPSEFEYLRGIALATLIRKFPDEESYEELWSRVAQELSVIKGTGSERWFLFMSDLVNSLKNRGVQIAPGQGTASSSFLCYLLGITDVRTTAFFEDLHFENFLNGWQKSICPQMDLILDTHGAYDAYDYLFEKYIGRVCNAPLYWRKDHASALQDVLAWSGASKNEIRKACRALPNYSPTHSLMPYTDPGCPLKSAQALIKWYNAADDETKALFQLADRMAGTVECSSAHAHTLILSEDPLIDHIPVHMAKESMSGETVVTSDFDVRDIERFGGGTVLNLVWSTAVEKDSDKVSYDYIQNHLDDVSVYSLFSEGMTDGIPYFDNPEMRSWLKQIKPSCFEDLVILFSISRMDRFNDLPFMIERKDGILADQKECRWDKYLSYGVLCHEETIQTICKQIGLDEKTAWQIKGAAIMMKPSLNDYEERFIQQAKESGYTEAEANECFTMIKTQGPLTYRKSHSLCCALLSYKIAYMKVHPEIIED